MQVQTVFKKNDVDYYEVSYNETLNLDLSVPQYSWRNIIVKMTPASVVNINANIPSTASLNIYIQKDTGGTITFNGTSIDTSAYFIIVGGDGQIYQYAKEKIEA